MDEYAKTVGQLTVENSWTPTINEHKVSIKKEIPIYFGVVYFNSLAQYRKTDLFSHLLFNVEYNPYNYNKEFYTMSFFKRV